MKLLDAHTGKGLEGKIEPFLVESYRLAQGAPVFALLDGDVWRHIDAHQVNRAEAKGATVFEIQIAISREEIMEGEREGRPWRMCLVPAPVRRRPSLLLQRDPCGTRWIVRFPTAPGAWFEAPTSREARAQGCDLVLCTPTLEALFASGHVALYATREHAARARAAMLTGEW